MHETKYTPLHNKIHEKYKYILNCNLFIKRALKVYINTIKYKLCIKNTSLKQFISYALQTYNIYTTHQPLELETHCKECVVLGDFLRAGLLVIYLLIRWHGVVV